MENKRAVRHEVPRDAMFLTKSEALQHQLSIIHEWKPQSKVWSLIYGRALLIGAASLSGVYINHRFRRKLKILHYANFPTMIGVTIGPAVMTSMLQTECVVEKILLMRFSCPLCLESRSALIQCVSGLLIPLIITPFANFAMTAGSGVYNTPHLNEVGRMMKIIRSTYQPMIPAITLIFTLHALLAGFITHSQIKSFLHIQDAQYLLDQDLKRQTYTPSKV